MTAALGRIDARDRILLELSVAEQRSDDQVAAVTGYPPGEVMWRRAELINGIAGQTGHSDPAGLLAVREALVELPPAAWRAPPPAAAAADGAAGPVREPWRAIAAEVLGFARRATPAATLLLPAALMVYLSFSGGGFFVGEPATASLVVAAAILLRLVVAERPFEGFGVPLAVTAAALALFATWTLASSAWSNASSRALLEFDRTLLYLLVLLLTGSVLRTEKRMRLLLRAMTLAIVAVCTIGLVAYIVPDVWSVERNTADLGLNYPLTYSNAVGLLAAFGIVFTLHLASDFGERPVVRVAGAAALPALAATLLLTLSRGAISVCIVAVLAYAVLGRSRGLLTALASAAPPSAVALAVSYHADLLQTPGAAGALDQGQRVAWVVAGCCFASLVLRALLLRVDQRVARAQLTVRLRGRALAGAVSIAVTALIAVGLALDAPGYVGDQYQLFLDRSSIPTSNARARLASASSNGRIDFWDVALDAYRRDPLKGNGAGTYELLWDTHRPSDTPASDGHSLYVEVLGELGIVGLVLVGGAILLVLGRLALLVRGPDRALYAALLAAGGAWAVQAGFDWDWELPAVTLPFFALAGLALASSRPVLGAPTVLTRVVVGLAVVFIAVTPARIAVSQDRLNESVQAFKRGLCSTASDRAAASIDALGSRPEPFQLLAYCAVDGGRARLAVQTMQEAADRDPETWEVYYGLAIVRGAARLDPRPAARAALRLNPKDVFVRNAAESFAREGTPDAWARAARRIPLLVY